MRLITTRLLICACLWLAGGPFTLTVAQDRPGDERLLKAVFVYNFAKFTHWPREDDLGPEVPLILCTTGDDGVVEAIRRLRGEQVRGRPVQVRKLLDEDDVHPCHLLYIAASEQQEYQKVLRLVQGQPILTVSEIPRFSYHGGIIELFQEQGRIRFIINLAVARDARLNLSSRLLSLAEVIGFDPGKP